MLLIKQNVSYKKALRSEERRVGQSVDLGGRRIIKKKKNYFLFFIFQNFMT